jgi:hypothetical protein
MIGAHAALIVAEDHVHHPVQAVLDSPMAAHDRTEKRREHHPRREVKSCFSLGFSADFAAALDHDDGLQPGLAMALLKPFDVMDHSRGPGFDTAVIAVNGGILADLGIGEALSLLFGDENLDILAQRSLVAL